MTAHPTPERDAPTAPDAPMARAALERHLAGLSGTAGGAPPRRAWWWIALAVAIIAAVLAVAGLLALGCSDPEPCDPAVCAPGPDTGGAGGAGGQGGAGGSGARGGAGGGGPCGGCLAPTPLCDEATDTCVACLDHPDCNAGETAKCDAGTCVPCDDSAQCAHLPGTNVCDEGACVECAVGQEAACMGGTTCNLLTRACVVDPAPASVGTCEPCSNDLHCITGRCIELEFEFTPIGHYCLAEAASPCDAPFTVLVDSESLSGAATATYCGIEETFTTCEAVLALQQDWHCSGTDGMCGPFMQPEVAVPGALCRQVGPNANRCTYRCAGAAECPATAATCGGAPTPTWCGG
jgi:hypothetical protein